jgi:hypothetical protein
MSALPVSAIANLWRTCGWVRSKRVATELP